MALGLTTEQKRRIRKEMQRRAQARMAWKMGGGKNLPSQTMKDWAGFGKTGSQYHKDQLAYIKSLKTNEKWKKAYKAAAKKGGKKGKANVEKYISKKGADATRPSPGKKVTQRTVKQGGGTDISGNKPAPRVIKAGPKYTADQKKWFAKHMKSGKKSKAFLKKTLDAKIKKGLL